MEIVFAVIGVILIGYLFWQSYLLSQYKKIVDNQKDVIVKLSRTIDTLKPFQVRPFGVGTPMSHLGYDN